MLLFVMRLLSVIYKKHCSVLPAHVLHRTGHAPAAGAARGLAFCELARMAAWLKASLTLHHSRPQLSPARARDQHGRGVPTRSGASRRERLRSRLRPGLALSARRVSVQIVHDVLG